MPDPTHSDGPSQPDEPVTSSPDDDGINSEEPAHEDELGSAGVGVLVPDPTAAQGLEGSHGQLEGLPGAQDDSAPRPAGEEDGERPPDRPLDPPKLVRLANLAREVLEEVRQMTPQESTIQDLAALYRRVEDQLKEALPQPLAQELDAMDLDMPFEDGASQDEVRIAYSGLIGWLGGLFQGLHATLLAAAPVLEVPEGLPPGPMPPGRPPAVRPGLEPARRPTAEDRKGEGYL